MPSLTGTELNEPSSENNSYQTYPTSNHWSLHQFSPIGNVELRFDSNYLQWISRQASQMLCGRHPVDSSLLLPWCSVVELVSASPIQWGLLQQLFLIGVWVSLTFFHLLETDLTFILKSRFKCMCTPLQVLSFPLRPVSVWHPKHIRVEADLWPWETLQAFPTAVGCPACCQQGAAPRGLQGNYSNTNTKSISMLRGAPCGRIKELHLFAFSTHWLAMGQGEVQRFSQSWHRETLIKLKRDYNNI